MRGCCKGNGRVVDNTHIWSKGAFACDFDLHYLNLFCLSIKFLTSNLFLVLLNSHGHLYLTPNIHLYYTEQISILRLGLRSNFADL